MNQQPNLDWECLEPAHFQPEVVETYPYEQLSHAVLRWFEEDTDRCDIIHGHEWGGIFTDLVTATYLRDVGIPSLQAPCTFLTSLNNLYFSQDVCEVLWISAFQSSNLCTGLLFAEGFVQQT